LLPPRLTGRATPTEHATLLSSVDLAPGSALALAGVGDATVVVPVTREAGEVRRADAGDGVFEAIASLVRDGEPIGPLVPTRLADVPAAAGERGIEVDQSNDSVAVGERVIVKLFPHAADGPQPGEDLPAHLAAVGSTDLPAPYGSVRWRRPDGSSLLVATVTAYLPEARDGWAWFLDLAVEAVASGDMAPSLAASEACGRLVGRLHLALATPSAVLGPEPVHTVIAGSYAAAAGSLLAEALTVTGGGEGERLAALAPRIATAFSGFDDVGHTPVQRIHGDLHVGQILAGPHGYAVTDFDGDPLAPASERTARQPAARDVAAFVRSLDHLGRLAQRRIAGADDAAERWIEAVRARFLDAYSSTLMGDGRAQLFDGRLLGPFEVLQECHEYVYAARYLPRWLPIPDLAMPRLLEEVVR